MSSIILQEHRSVQTGQTTEWGLKQQPVSLPLLQSPALPHWIPGTRVAMCVGGLEHCHSPTKNKDPLSNTKKSISVEHKRSPQIIKYFTPNCPLCRHWLKRADFSVYAPYHFSGLFPKTWQTLGKLFWGFADSFSGPTVCISDISIITLWPY